MNSNSKSFLLKVLQIDLESAILIVAAGSIYSDTGNFLFQTRGEEYKKNCRGILHL